APAGRAAVGARQASAGPHAPRAPRAADRGHGPRLWRSVVGAARPPGAHGMGEAPPGPSPGGWTRGPGAGRVPVSGAFAGEVAGRNAAMLEVQHLRKEYRNLTAVKDLSFRLEQGDIFGFIGPNGAGKTTTIKILATLLRPTAGRATIDGIDVVRDPEAVRGIIGYMPDCFGVFVDIKGREYLDV